MIEMGEGEHLLPIIFRKSLLTTIPFTFLFILNSLFISDNEYKFSRFSQLCSIIRTLNYKERETL